MLWGPACILVLGERSVFCCRDSGNLQWMIKLDYSQSCLHIYHVSAAKEDGDRNIKFMIATHSNTLMVYDNVMLQWTAQVTHPPVAIRTATFGGLKGLVVTLDELGHVICSYMGTDPSHFTPPTPQAREVNYEKVDKEYKELQKVVRESIKGSEVTPVRTDNTLTINSEVVDKPRIITLSDGDHVSSDEGNSPDAIQLCCEVIIQLSTDHMIHDVMMTVQTNQPLVVHPCVFRWNEMAAGVVNPITLTFVCTPNLLPTCTSAVVTVMHSVSQSRPHITQHTVPLPLSLFCMSVLPAKTAEYKVRSCDLKCSVTCHTLQVTIDTNSPPVSLMTLFPEFSTSGDNNVPQNAIGFQLLPGAEVTMVVSKTGDRYRLQSDCFEAIGLFEAELVKRLAEHYHDKSPPFKALFTEQLPLKEYFEIVEDHFKLRVEREQYLLAVEQHSQQFRAIQKRLLTRFKDKTPSSLQHLDTLLDGTFLQLIALSDKCQSIEEELSVVNNRLCCATNFIVDLVRLSAGMSDEECDVLRVCLCVSPDHLIEQGWEETTTTAVMHMLVTCLSKNNKEQQTIPGSLEMPADTGKLKRHLSLFFDRLLKGGRLNTTGEVTTWSSHDKRGPVSLPPINDVTSDDVIQEED
ncbi:protein PTHB1-like isoform X1 [Dysidea avara]|uniref:protein PTHB1-like isoform X1 n=2 Tax=Dysidea avara TaxID=196820 RepID=UPI003320B1E3